jgi:hypothetical protein
VRQRIKAISTPTKILAGVVAGLLAGGAAVFAHGTDGTMAHACVDYSLSTGPNVRIVASPGVGNPGSACPNGVAVDLATSATQGTPGPQGPQGPQGEQGPQGPQGPAGAAGSNGTNGSDGTSGSSNSKTSKLRTVRKEVGPNRVVAKSLRVSCPKGQRIVTGGYSIPGNIPAITAKESRPNGTTGWFARAFRARGTGAWKFVVYAVCST